MFLQKIEASPAALLVKAMHHRKILFSLREEKIGRAQNEKSKEYFSVVRRALASGGEVASFVGGFSEMGSDFVQGVEPNRMIRVLRLGDIQGEDYAKEKDAVTPSRRRRSQFTVLTNARSGMPDTRPDKEPKSLRRRVSFYKN